MNKFSSDTEKSVGIIAIILGVFVIALLFINLFTLIQIIGIGISFTGMWLLILSIANYKYNYNESIVYLILSIISFITAIGLFLNLNFNWINGNILVYLTGFIIIITGIIALLGPLKVEKTAGSIGLVLGTLFVLIYYYTVNLYILAAITGIWLFVIGIVQFMITYE
jgi:uncharacterized membrane protein HdeD (DUF308 family)